MHAPEFTVNVTVAPGATYYARLKFSENELSEANRRAISIYVNDEQRVKRMDVWATVAASDGYKKIAAHGDRWDSRPERRALDLVFNGIQPRNGIIEIRLVGESIKGVATEAMLQALEVGTGEGGASTASVVSAP